MTLGQKTSIALIGLLSATACVGADARGNGVKAEVSVVDQCLSADEDATLEDGGTDGGVPSALITAGDSEVHVEVVASFRCGQEVCARIVETGATIRCTVEPCDLDGDISRCNCVQRLSVIIPSSSGERTVEVYRRGDNQSGRSEPELIASERVAVE